MRQVLIMGALMGALTTSMVAATTANIVTAPLQKSTFDTKKSLFISPDGGFTCPDGYDLYVRALKPDAKGKEPVPQGDYESFYFARPTSPAQPAIIVSRPGAQEYLPVCLQVK